MINLDSLQSPHWRSVSVCHSHKPRRSGSTKMMPSSPTAAKGLYLCLMHCSGRCSSLMKRRESSQLARVCFTRKLGKKSLYFTAHRNCWCCFFPLLLAINEIWREGRRDRKNKEKRLDKMPSWSWSINLFPIRSSSSSRCTVYVLLQGTHPGGKKPDFNNICISKNVK